MGPGHNPLKVTPRGSVKVSGETLSAWADRALEERGYVAVCGHHWDWGGDLGVYAWVVARGLKWSDRPGGNCEVPSGPGDPCNCCADHVVHPAIPSFGKGTPPEVVRRVMREAAAEGVDPRRLLDRYWEAYVRCEWRFGRKTTWRLLSCRGLDDPDIITISKYYVQDHGEGATMVPSQAARREAERLRRRTGR